MRLMHDVLWDAVLLLLYVVCLGLVVWLFASGCIPSWVGCLLLVLTVAVGWGWVFGCFTRGGWENGVWGEGGRDA